jgi:hypothetical protein
MRDCKKGRHVILWVKKDAAGAACDQRAELKMVVGGNLHVLLLGTGETAIVAPSEVCGLEFDDKLRIMFEFKSMVRNAVINNQKEKLC